MHGQWVVIGAHCLQEMLGFSNRLGKVSERILKLICLHTFMRTYTRRKINSVCFRETRKHAILEALRL